jgi:hypothetical protein
LERKKKKKEESKGKQLGQRNTKRKKIKVSFLLGPSIRQLDAVTYPRETWWGRTKLSGHQICENCSL